MIETGNLSEFNDARQRDINSCNDAEIVAILSKNSNCFPNIHFLLTETTKFYTENFPDLQQYIKREKRLVVFETPSRVSMTHEYTIEGAGDLSQGFYFLFNTRERLSWLKIFLEDKRVSIASRSKVVSLLIKKLDAELNILAVLLNSSRDDVALRLYEASDGKPCFVEFNHKEYKGQQSLLLSISFFDSIRNKKTLYRGEKIRYREKWWSPLQEKQITYNYSTISGDANAWIYFKSPANFVLSVSNNATEGQYEASPSNDDEITSLVLTPKGEKLSVDFKISINVPNALKTWYNMMLYLAYLGLLWGIVLLGNVLCGSIYDKTIETFNNCSYAIIAALIATRGWLMSEEQVMKKISNRYTFIISVLIILITILSIVPHTKSENNIEHLNSAINIKNNDITISLDSVVYDIGHTVNSKVNDTLNIMCKTCDSLSIKSKNEGKISAHCKEKTDVGKRINSYPDTIMK